MHHALALLLLFAAMPVAADACRGFHWDVRQELAAMRAAPRAIAANTNIQQAGFPLAIGEHFLVTLAPENEVAFIVPPGHAAREESPHGGILYFDVREAGRYRFSLDTGHWVDVIDSGDELLDGSTARVLEPVGHDHDDDCATMHKVLAFDLAAGITYRVHLSGRAAARVNLVITRDPPG